MNEITDKNFKQIYPIFTNALQNADFVAIDSEFSGIKIDNKLKESFFDTAESRYDLLRTNIEKYLIIQFGITTFEYNDNLNTYNAKGFTFYLTPRSLPFKNKHFLWQLSAIEFLAEHNFDFNKFVYEGLSYLDEEDEKELRGRHKRHNLMENLEKYVSYKEEYDLKDNKQKVFEWLMSKDEQKVSCFIKTVSPLQQYITHKELRSTFPNVWTLSGYKSVVAIRVSPDMRKSLEESDGMSLDDALLDAYLGFNNVFQLLVSLDKPIVGHNVFMDCMFIHQQFYRPLPMKYKQFKQNINKLFPLIYDTKVLSAAVRNILPTATTYKRSTLQNLYRYFNKHSTANSPHVILDTIENDSDANCMQPHNAGWDSYCTGYIFIKIAYLMFSKNNNHDGNRKITSHSELMEMSQVTKFMNNVYMMGGTLPYLRFDGPDLAPKTQRSFVKRLHTQCISTSEAHEKSSTTEALNVMSSKIHTLTTRPSSERTADVLRYHQNRKKYATLYKYNYLRRLLPRKFMSWSSAVLSNGCLKFMLYRMFKSKSL